MKLWYVGYDFLCNCLIVKIIKITKELMVNFFLYLCATVTLIVSFFDSCKAMEQSQPSHEMPQYWVVPYVAGRIPEQPVAITTEEFETFVRCSAPIRSINEALSTLPGDTQKILYLPEVSSEGFLQLRPLVNKLAHNESQDGVQSDINNYKPEDIVPLMYNALYLAITPLFNGSKNSLITKIKEDTSIINSFMEQKIPCLYMARLPLSIQKEISDELLSNVSYKNEIVSAMSSLVNYSECFYWMYKDKKFKSYSQGKQLSKNLLKNLGIKFSDDEKPILIHDKRFMIVSDKKGTNIFDIEKRAPILNYETLAFDHAAVSRNGKFFVFADQNTISIVNTSSKERVKWPALKDVPRYRLDINDDGQLVMYGDDRIYIMNRHGFFCERKKPTSIEYLYYDDGGNIIGIGNDSTKFVMWRISPKFNELPYWWNNALYDDK